MPRSTFQWFLATAVLPFAVPPVALAQDGIEVSPGDPDGLYETPSVDLGAHLPGTPSTPDDADTDDNGDAAGSSQPASPLGFSFDGDPLDLDMQLEIPSFGEQEPDAGTVAQSVLDQLELPRPVPQHSPDVAMADGRRATVVGEHTWVWTDPSMWRPHTERIDAQGTWVEVTAEPTHLRVDPGTGEAPAVCAGPGTAYTPDAGPHAPSPDCGLMLETSSWDQPGEQITTEWAVTWRITWRGAGTSGPTEGSLPDMTSRTAHRLAVVEAQSLGT